MNRRHNGHYHNTKKGFTLIELIVVIALVGLLSVLLLDVITSVSQSYLYLREKSQAISLANDLLNGIRDELKKTDTVYLAYVDQSGGISIDGATTVDYGKGIQINKNTASPDYKDGAMQLKLNLPNTTPPKDNDFFDILSGRIYLSNIVTDEGKKRSVIECDLNDSGNFGMFKSKYYYSYQITGLKFNILANKLINISKDELVQANFTQINNILQVSFDIKSFDGKTTLFSVKHYNLHLDNLLANLFKNDLDSGLGLSTGMVSWEDLGIYSRDFIPIDPDKLYPSFPGAIKEDYDNLEDLNVYPYNLLIFAPRTN